MTTVNFLDALAEGRLSDAIVSLSVAVEASPDNPAARLSLVELQILAGQFTDAWESLREIQSLDPNWPASRRWYRQLIRAAVRRARGRAPEFLDHRPAHVRHRLRAIRAIRESDPQKALVRIDRADRCTPHLVGHIDGREFDGIRDAGDFTASVLEVLVGSRYFWLPFEQVRRIVLQAPTQILDSAYRPARLTLTDGTEFDAVVPIVYADSVEDVHRLGLETDLINPRGGPVKGLGAKLLLAGEEELPLGELRQLDLREWR